MFRPGVSRQLFRSLNASTNQALRSTSSPVAQQWRSQMGTISRRPQLVPGIKPLAPTTMALVRYASERKNVNEIDSAHEAEIAKKKLQPHPELVSLGSSTRSLTEEVGAKEREHETDMLAGVKSDMQTIRDTFSLQDVPREAYYMGLAGVLPYLATSLSTVYCAWEIHHAAETGVGFLMSEKSAELLLHVIEPLQIGYGAVILSFLGAIHWGLEWAGYGGRKGYARYNIGVAATALAWPTILLPAEYALISQFLIFNFMYYNDSRASKRGWAPPWYGVYRFVLTFIVGGSIVVSLIGRGQIADRIGTAPNATERIRKFQASQQEQIEEEEEARRNFLAEKDEEDEEEAEGAEDGGEEEEKEDSE